MVPRVRSLFTEQEYRASPGRASIAVIVATLRRVMEALTASRFAAVVVHREAIPFGTALVERLIGRRARHSLFDFDDAVWLPQPHSRRPFSSLLRSPRKFDTIVSAVDIVLAGNAMLAGRASRSARDVRLLPTTVDTDAFAPQAGSRGDGVVLGWIGSPSTAYYLEAIAPTLERVLARRAGARLEIVGGPAPAALADRAIARHWSLPMEAEDVRRFDIGLQPLANDEWTRGKCGYKALQYMSVGIPTISSPVGVATEMITHGRNGFLAGTEDEWSEALVRLIDDAPLRRELGAAAREDAVSNWSVRRWAPVLVDALVAK